MGALTDPFMYVVFTCPECGEQFEAEDRDWDNWSFPLFIAHQGVVDHWLHAHRLDTEDDT